MLVNGRIPKGANCPYRYDCGHMKYTACNGEGCPFTRGDSHTNDFSCATSRLIELIKKNETLERR